MNALRVDDESQDRIHVTVPDIAEMREAAMVAAMRGHLVLVEDPPDADRPWLANGEDKWHYVDDKAVEEFFAHPDTKAFVLEACCALAEDHYRRTMATLEEWRELYPAAFIAAIEPHVRARAELDITREELNATVRRYAEDYDAALNRQAETDSPLVSFRARVMNRGMF